MNSLTLLGNYQLHIYYNTCLIKIYAILSSTCDLHGEYLKLRASLLSPVKNMRSVALTLADDIKWLGVNISSSMLGITTRIDQF